MVESESDDSVPLVSSRLAARTGNHGATPMHRRHSSSSDASQVFVLTYTARDAAGNDALPLRRYVAVVPRCRSPERWCEVEAGLTQCSSMGLCSKALSGLGAASSSTSSKAAAAAAVYVPPVDRTPPRLRLLGSGTAAMTAAGAMLMIDNITWNAAWSDPGATATDDVDGNLTTSIQTFGVGAEPPAGVLLWVALVHLLPGNCDNS